MSPRAPTEEEIRAAWDSLSEDERQEIADGAAGRRENVDVSSRPSGNGIGGFAVNEAKNRILKSIFGGSELPSFGLDTGGAAVDAAGVPEFGLGATGDISLAEGSGGAAAEGSSLASGLGTAAGIAGTVDGGRRVIGAIMKGNARKSAYGGAEAGAGLGYLAGGPIGAVIGAPIGLAAGALLGHIKTGKSEDQQARDAVRANLKSVGAIDNDYNITLADGSKFNIGLDGHASLKNLGPDSRGSMTRNMWNTDGANPTTAQAVGWANPLALIITGGDKGLKEQFAGYLTNAAQSNATSLDDIKSNFQAIMGSFQLDSDRAAQMLRDLNAQGRLSKDELDASLYGLGTLGTKSSASNPTGRSTSNPSAAAPSGSSVQRAMDDSARREIANELLKSSLQQPDTYNGQRVVKY